MITRKRGGFHMPLEPKKTAELLALLNAEGVPKEEIPEEVWGYIEKIDSKIRYLGVDEDLVNWDALYKMVGECISIKNWIRLSEDLRRLAEEISEIGLIVGLRRISYI
jgi:hypothetical protein